MGWAVGGLGSLCRVELLIRGVSLWSAIFLGPGVTIQVQVSRLRLLLVAVLGRGPLRLLVPGFLGGGSAVPELSGALDSLLDIQLAGLALGTRVCKVFAEGLLARIGVEAFNVLPRVACLAVNRVSIIIRKVANTLDRVRLFIRRRVVLARIVRLRRGGGRDNVVLTRNRYLRRRLLMRLLRLFCHNPKGSLGMRKRGRKRRGGKILAN